GDFSKFVLRTFQRGERPLERVVCINPLTWTSADAEPRANPGSRPIGRPSTIVSALTDWLTGKAKQLNFMASLERGAFGARCDAQGALRMQLEGAPTGFLATGVFSGGNLHGGESSLYWRALRDNAE